LDLLLRKPELLLSWLSQFSESERVMLNEIGIECLERFERTGSTNYLAFSITMLEKALEMTPNESHYRAQLLDILGTALWLRFEKMGSMEDLNRAVEVSEQAV